MGFVRQIGQGIGLIGPDPTAPPDMAGAAAAAAASSREAALFNTGLNRANQVGPDGTSTWTNTGGSSGSPGTWTQTTALSQGNQELYDQQQRLSRGLGGTAEAALGRTQSTLSSPLDLSEAPARQLGPQGPIDDTSRRRVEEALMARLAPQLQSDEASLRTRLLNSGIEVGTDAYNREMGNFSQRVNDARMQTLVHGGAEEDRQQGLSRDNASFQNQNRAAAITEALNLRQQPLAELNALRTGAMPGTPKFADYYTGGSSAGADYLGAAKAQAGANSTYDTASTAQSAQYGDFLGKLAMMAMLV